MSRNRHNQDPDPRKNSERDREPEEDPVYIRAEVSGPRDEVLAQLAGGGRSGDEGSDVSYEYAKLDEVVRDLTMVLEAVEKTDGGIRSKIAAETEVELGEWHTRKILELLREYDLVELEKNTWIPGPACERLQHDR